MSLIIELANGLGLAPKDILLIAKTAHYRYKEFRIPKRKPGEFRHIAQPAKEVKLLQKWAIDNILSKLPIHDAATAYIEGRNIKYNATKHMQNAFILKMDFANFFPSIVPKDFKLHLLTYMPNAYTPEDVELLSRILFWKKKGETRLQLSIGGPSSPALSNSIMFDFDTAISKECISLNVIYTRYADDLTFSASSFEELRLIQEKVTGQLQKLAYPKLAINTDKTVFLSKKGNRTITGLVLTNENKISLGRDKKREISCQINWFKTRKLDESAILKLRGMLCYAKDVEPEFLQKMRKKYSDNLINEIIHYNTFQS